MDDRAGNSASLSLGVERRDAGPTLHGLEKARTFELEENADVINVSPEAFRDPRGGFLIADDREAQVRRYSAEGRLQWRAGRRGGGPGEFSAPTAVVRLPSGEVAVFDRAHRLVVFDSTGSAVVRTFRTQLRQVSDAATLNDSSVLVAGIAHDDWGGSRLHLLDPATGTIRAGFFAPFAHTPYKAAATIAGWTKVSVRADTIAAVFALSDSVHFFTADGRPIRSTPIPFAQFRPASQPLPGNGNADVRARVRWLSSFDLVADVHWLGNGDILVPYQNIDAQDGATRHWHLLRMTRDGRRLLELREVPRLLEVDGAALFFVDPDAEAPNRWIEARLPR